MNERMQEMLHRWLPVIAFLGLLVSLASFLLVWSYVAPAIEAEWGLFEEEQRLYLEALEAREGELTAALDRIAGLIDTLGGPRQTQETLMRAVAREDVIGEVWLTNSKGLIEHYGRHKPPWRHVAHFPPSWLPQLVEGIPEELLGPMQRTAVLLPVAMGGYSSLLRFGAPGHDEPWGARPVSGPEGGFHLKHLVFSTKPRRIASHMPVEMRPFRDGLMAAVVSQPPDDRYVQWSERTEGLTVLGSISHRLFLAGLIAFWLTIPSWMLLDARRRGERAAAWGLFGLLGNVMALVVYLLVRRDDDPEAAGGP